MTAKDIFLKYFKDGIRGLMVSMTPLLFATMSGTQTVLEAIGGVVSMGIGFLAGAIRASNPALSDKWKVAGDVFYGLLIAFQPVLQNGISTGAKAGYLVCGLLIASLGFLTNYLKDKFATATGVLKIAKDLFISLAGAFGPALQAGMDSGMSLIFVVKGFAHIGFSITANTIEHDLFGLSDTVKVPDPPLQKAG